VGLGDAYTHLRLKMLPRKDVLFALRDSPYSTPGDLDALVELGFWISDKLGRDKSIRVAKAIRTRRERVKLCSGREHEDSEAPITPITLLSHPHYILYPSFPPWLPPPPPTFNLFSTPLCRRTITKQRTSFSTTLLRLNYNPATHPTPSSLSSKT
jgi:hypothetical protein